jgi:hypothetical protein
MSAARSKFDHARRHLDGYEGRVGATHAVFFSFGLFLFDVYRAGVVAVTCMPG